MQMADSLEIHSEQKVSVQLGKCQSFERIAIYVAVAQTLQLLKESIRKTAVKLTCHADAMDDHLERSWDRSAHLSRTALAASKIS